MFVLYRAMHPDEFNETLRTGKLYFRSNFKFFSHDLRWIRERVQAGGFNLATFGQQDYSCLLAFEIDDRDRKLFKVLNKKEHMLSKRDMSDVRMKIREVTWKEYQQATKW